MLLKIIFLIIMCLLGVAGMALIYAGQYLYKEKCIKSGLREGLNNISISKCPENNDAKKINDCRSNMYCCRCCDCFNYLLLNQVLNRTMH